MIQAKEIEVDRDAGNFHYDTTYEYDAGVGLSEDVAVSYTHLTLPTILRV